MVTSLLKVLRLPSSASLTPRGTSFINTVSQATDIPAVFQSGPDHDFEVGVGTQIWKQGRSSLPGPHRLVEGTLREGPKQSDLQRPTVTTLPPQGKFTCSTTAPILCPPLLNFCTSCLLGVWWGLEGRAKPRANRAGSLFWEPETSWRWYLKKSRELLWVDANSACLKNALGSRTGPLTSPGLPWS